jgi:hypothetical protein
MVRQKGGAKLKIERPRTAIVCAFAAVALAGVAVASIRDNPGDRTEKVVLDSMGSEGFTLHRTIRDGEAGVNFWNRDSIAIASEALHLEPSPCENNPHPTVIRFKVENYANDVVYDATLRCF